MNANVNNLTVDDLLRISNINEHVLLPRAVKAKELYQKIKRLDNEITERQFQILDLQDEIENLKE